jgi:hypothetical protein
LTRWSAWPRRKPTRSAPRSVNPAETCRGEYWVTRRRGSPSVHPGPGVEGRVARRRRLAQPLGQLEVVLLRQVVVKVRLVEARQRVERRDRLGRGEGPARWRCQRRSGRTGRGGAASRRGQDADGHFSEPATRWANHEVLGDLDPATAAARFARDRLSRGSPPQKPPPLLPPACSVFFCVRSSCPEAYSGSSSRSASRCASRARRRPRLVALASATVGRKDRGSRLLAVRMRFLRMPGSSRPAA